MHKCAIHSIHGIRQKICRDREKPCNFTVLAVEKEKKRRRNEFSSPLRLFLCAVFERFICFFLCGGNVVNEFVYPYLLRTIKRRGMEFLSNAKPRLFHSNMQGFCWKTPSSVSRQLYYTIRPASSF